MALNGLSQIYGNGKSFIPHVEMGALRWSQRKYVMLPRVTNYGDMTGWNVRKISEYLKFRSAQTLAEDTEIPNTTLARARKAEIEPKEIGDRYRISDRRVSTDLEHIIGDVVEALGTSIGEAKERDLTKTAYDSFVGGTLGSSSVDYSLDLPIDGQHEFMKTARTGLIYHVLHPFQARKILKDLVAFSGSSAGAPLDFRNAAIRSWQVPGFDNLNIVVGDYVGRNIINNILVYGTGGTFRLALFDGQTVSENVTAAITVSATPATMKSNIKAALEALTFSGNGTWTVGGTTLLDMTITPPANLWLDADSELRVAVDYANPTLIGEKSAYDLITGLSGAPLDINSASLGVVVTEKSATAKGLLFQSDALVHDSRDKVRGSFELVNQGRTAEYAAYTTYGVKGWRREKGMFIVTKANSAFATG